MNQVKENRSPLWTPVKEAINCIAEAPKRENREIVILGAGIAGLAAAYELVRQSKVKKVTIIEGSNRVGGRLMTHRFGPKPQNGEEDTRPYHELAAMRIPEQIHDYTWHYLREMKLKVRKFINTNRNAFYEIRGQKFPKKDLKTLLSLFEGLFDDEKDILRGGTDDQPENAAARLYGYFMELEMEKLRQYPKAAYYLVNGMFNVSGETGEYLRELDRQTIRGYFKKLVDDGKASSAAVELLGATMILEVRWQWSLATDLRGSLTNTPGGGRNLWEIVGGFDTLPSALYNKLIEDGKDKFKIHYNQQVTAIKSLDNGVQITTRNTETGKEETATYPQVLCTLPFPVMRLMNLDGLSSEKMRAIRNMQYASAVKVLLLSKTRFWEKQGIFGGRSVTDRLSREMYYPSDFEKEQDPGKQLDDSVPNQCSGEYWNVQTQCNEDSDLSDLSTVESNTNRPGVLLGSYSFNYNARQLGRLPGEKQDPTERERQRQQEKQQNDHQGLPFSRKELVIRDMTHTHEELRENIIDCVTMDWDEFPWAKGAVGITPTGDLTKYYQDGRKPEKSLFFAGEHISIAPGWTQGALESSLWATREMLKQDI